MGDIHPPSPVLLIIAATSRYDAALDWTHSHAANHFGPIAHSSQRFDFTETNYYTATMGHDLKKQFFTFDRLIDPANLPRIKRLTNDWEHDYAATHQHPEPRPLNLDPGYITPAKLVLASTKDHAHRIYLRDGIYAEITLSFRKRAWQCAEWTYPDYRRHDFQQFFSLCRDWLLNCGTTETGVK